MKKLAVVAVTLIALTSLISAADYFNPYFLARQEQLLPPTPCATHGGLLGPASLGHDDGSLFLAFTCQDQRVILWRDQRPGSGNGAAVGVRSSAIRVQLDAPNGTTRPGLVTGGGWAFECGHRLIDLKVTVGGITVLDELFAGVARPDVIAAYGDCATQAAFGFTVDLSALTPGAYPVQVQVADDQGLTQVSNTLTVTVQP